MVLRPAWDGRSDQSPGIAGGPRCCKPSWWPEVEPGCRKLAVQVGRDGKRELWPIGHDLTPVGVGAKIGRPECGRLRKGGRVRVVGRFSIPLAPGNRAYIPGDVYGVATVEVFLPRCAPVNGAQQFLSCRFSHAVQVGLAPVSRRKGFTGCFPDSALLRSASQTYHGSGKFYSLRRFRTFQIPRDRSGCYGRCLWSFGGSCCYGVV